MASITIDVPDSQLQKLQDMAKKHGVSTEVLIRSSLDGWLSSSHPKFSNAASHVLKKNTELYKRLS